MRIVDLQEAGKPNKDIDLDNLAEAYCNFCGMMRECLAAGEYNFFRMRGELFDQGCSHALRMRPEVDTSYGVQIIYIPTTYSGAIGGAFQPLTNLMSIFVYAKDGEKPSEWNADFLESRVKSDFESEIVENPVMQHEFVHLFQKKSGNIGAFRGLLANLKTSTLCSIAAMVGFGAEPGSGRDRAAQKIKQKGYNVEPAEVEAYTVQLWVSASVDIDTAKSSGRSKSEAWDMLVKEHSFDADLRKYIDNQLAVGYLKDFVTRDNIDEVKRRLTEIHAKILDKFRRAYP